MAKSAPGVAAAESRVRNSIAGPGSGRLSADQPRPASIETIIGFASSPRNSTQSVASRMRPCRVPVTITVMRVEKTTRSMIRINRTGPAAASPSSTISIGTPRKPVLPMT